MIAEFRGNADLLWCCCIYAHRSEHSLRVIYMRSFRAHQESVHGKLSEVMKMFALDILVLHDVSVAVLCQKEDGDLLKAPTGLTSQAATAMSDIISVITVRSPLGTQRSHDVLLSFVGETEQIQRLSCNALMDDRAEFKKKSCETYF